MAYSSSMFRRIGIYSSRRLLLNKYGFNHRTTRFIGFVPILGRVFKLRYLFLGSAFGGGVAIHNVLSFNFFYLRK